MYRQIVDRLHVGQSNRDVLRAVYRALRPASRKPKMKAARRLAYRLALKQHSENQKLYRVVMSGSF